MKILETLYHYKLMKNLDRVKQASLRSSSLVIFLINLCLLLVLQLVFFKAYLSQLLIFDCLLYMCLYAFKVYQFEKMESFADLLISVFVGSSIALILSVIFLLLLSFGFPKKIMFLNWLLSIVFISLLNKSLFYIYLKYAPTKKYLVLSKGESVNQYVIEIANTPYKKVEIVAFTNPDSSLINEAKVNDWTILFANKSLIQKKLKEVQQRRVNYMFLPEFIEKELKRIPLEVIDTFKEYYEVAFNIGGESSLTRLLDVVISFLILIFASPLFLVIAIAIYFEDGSPVIFRQDRVGKNQNIFTLHKFRTMNKEEKGEALFASSEQGRITKTGNLIRKFRLDEFPQFYDALCGAMSIVGPRPEQILFSEQFNKEIPYYSYRCNVKPGITGWAQINYDYSETLKEVKNKLSYDLWYVKHKSTLLDLRIILQTIEVMLFKKGAR